MACYDVYFVARFYFTVLAWGRAVFLCPRSSGLSSHSMRAPLHVLIVLLYVVLGASFFPPFSRFSPTLLSLYFIAIVILLFIIFISTEPLALCDRCLSWGWVWRAGLVAGLQVGQAFGMFLLPGFGVGSSSPWVPGHPTSMCDSGVKLTVISKWGN